MIPEIRFYNGTPTAQGVSFSRGKWHAHDPNVDYVECNDGKSVEATWSDPGPVKFSKISRKCMIPFTSKSYQTLDDLALDIRCAGINLVDMRKTIGVVRDIDHFHELLETHTLERRWFEEIFIRREEDGRHGDIWQLSERAFEVIRMHKLVIIGKNNSRQTFIRGRKTFADLGEYVQKSISESFAARPIHSTTTSYSPIYEIAVFPRPTYTSPIPKTKTVKKLKKPKRIKKTRKARTTPTDIFAYDDTGNPITELDITLESPRAAPRSMPRSLIPDAPVGCSDDHWEKLMLTEQIKFRRRTEDKAPMPKAESMDGR